MVIIRCCCILLLLLFIKIIEALNYADFGLPNNKDSSSCLLTFNDTVYIFNKQSLSIKFNQIYWNSIPPNITQLTNNLTVIQSCSITQSGKLVLLPKQQDEPLKVIDNINTSWNLNNDIQYLGSKLAIDTFITKTVPSIQPFSIVTFNDYIIFYNGNQTFSLDTRYKTLWTFNEISLDSKRKQQQSINILPPTLYATSRWILSFRVESNSNIFIDCFDPYSFIWLDTITSIISTTPNNIDSIQVIPVVSSATIETDSLLILVAETQGTTNNNHAETTNTFWKLDISTSLPTNFTLTKLNPTIHQSDVVLYNGATTDLSTGGSVVVTPLDDEMTLFYGGGAKQLQFFNTTSLTFSPDPQWLNTTINNNNNTTTNQPEEPSSNNYHYLAIILGSVFGSLFFIIIVIVLLFWYCRRKRRNKNQNNRELLRPKNIKNEKLEPSLSSPSSKKNWLLLLLLGKKPKREEEQLVAVVDESQFTLSPITPVSPINLFPLPSDSNSHNNAPSTSLNNTNDEGIIIASPPPKVFKSRFQEVFDYNSFPITRNTTTINKQDVTASKSLPLENTTSSEIITTTNNKKEEEPQTIPRSVSSYV